MLWFLVPTSNVAYAASSRESESNNTAATANTISINSTITGNISSSSDVDWYKFTTSNKGYFNLTFEHTFVESTSSYWRISIFDSTGVNNITGGTNNYFYVRGNSNGGSSNYGIPAGTYYVKVQKDDYHSANDYSVTVNFTAASDWETENNNTKDTSNSLQVNQLSALSGEI